ncbi:MAG TPA: type II toxin-antitoxin system RelE/ParE family toxin [Bacteroidota bacterium]
MAANNYRLLGFFDGATLLILTGAFLKKQQKTPQREIELAQNRRDEYYQRRKQS